MESHVRPRVVAAIVVATLIASTYGGRALAGRRLREAQGLPEVGDSHQALEKAYGNYASEVLKNPGAGPEERAARRKRVLDPAVNRYSEALDKQSGEFSKPVITSDKKLSKEARRAAKREKRKRQAARGLLKGGKGGPPGAMGAKGSGSKKVGQPQEPVKPRPEVTVDGRKLKKVIDFGGGDSKKPAPAPEAPAGLEGWNQGGVQPEEPPAKGR